MTSGKPTRARTRARLGKVVAGFVLLAVLLGVLLPAGLPTSARGEPPVREYAVKAAFLYNFAKFVEWPADAFADPASPLVLCVIGEDPFGDAFKPLKGKTVNGRPLAIRHAATLDGVGQCHLLFISSSEKPFLPGILSATKGSNVLTVGDMEDFGRAGGFVTLVNEENRVGIEVNLEAVQRTRLKISSKLLSLAKIVKSGPR
jgi:hypothetical protein